MIEYPKTRNLHKRDGARMLEDQLQLPEAASVAYWQAHEKIDGTNIRVDFRLDREGFLATAYNGRTDNAQIHDGLREVIEEAIDHAAPVMHENLRDFGVNSITVFAEGIGPKIQGNLYALTRHQLVAFDVLVDDKIFLSQDKVAEYASILGIERAPRMPALVGDFYTQWFATATEWLQYFVREVTPSYLNPETRAEGLILRPETELRTQSGERVQIKVKHRDYPGSAQ